MLDINKNHWFYLEPYVYCNLKKEKFLLYSTIDGSKIAIKSKTLNILIKELHKDENYGSILLDREMLSQEKYTTFINKAVERRIGRVVPIDISTKKPIKPLPILRLDRDVERDITRGDAFLGKNILENLLVVNLYLNTICDAGCNGCQTYFKQTTCCTEYQDNLIELSTDQIEGILSQISHSSIGRVNILGGNVFSYQSLGWLASRIEEFGIEVSIWSHYTHVKTTLANYKKAKFNILVTPSFNEVELKRVAQDNNGLVLTYHFLVENKDDVEQAEKMASKYKISSYLLHPIYNGNNIAFFEENVFINEEDVFYKTFTHREIFAHQKLNTNFFGMFNILPNGDVKADVSSESIGNINVDKFIELIHRELLQNTAWRRLREGDQCSDCLHQFLCPSPSGYERAIGWNNLCRAFE